MSNQQRLRTIFCASLVVSSIGFIRSRGVTSMMTVDAIDLTRATVIIGGLITSTLLTLLLLPTLYEWLEQDWTST